MSALCLWLRPAPVFVLYAITAISALGQQATPDLSGASLQDLVQLHVNVSSFARKDQDLWVTPAAVFIITKEDIERSAAASIPELFRMVPGVQVSQIDASTWAVSARGFNSAYSTKLLVLIDGRTVYSEIYSGAHWDENDLPLEEIERIEVIRGPGAAIWGTNAVNGVVNIITKRARSSLGLEVSGSTSITDQVTHVRYGGSVGDRIQYLGYALFRDRKPFKTMTGADAFDGQRSLRGGGRIDWQRNSRDWLTLSGNLYQGHFRQLVRTEFDVPLGPGGEDRGSNAGGYLIGRWERKLTRSDSALQAYFDDSSRNEFSASTRTRTLSSEYQDHIVAGPRNDLVLGAELRFTSDHLSGPVPLTDRSDYRNYLADVFFQDEIALRPHRLILTVGSKVQQGTLAGFQLQPSARLLWSPSERQSLWTAVSRAAVAPSIQDKQIRFPLSFGSQDGLPSEAMLRGASNIKPETVIAYEAGYRRRISNSLILDVASFFNVNHRLLSLSVADTIFIPHPQPHLFTALQYTNGFRANSTGVETAISWKPVGNISFQGSYSWMQVHLTQTGAGTVGLADSWSTPRNVLTASGSWQITPHWNLNAFFDHADALPRDLSFQFDQNATENVPTLNRLDVHVLRKLGRYTEVDAGGINLFEPRHLEFGSGTAAIDSQYVPRNFFVRAKWTF